MKLSCVKISDSQARSVLQDLGLNILLYEKQTRLINSKYSGLTQDELEFC